MQVNKLQKFSTETTSFLGIDFDYKVSFNSQINKLQNRCQRALNIIKCAVPNTLLILYKNYIRSIIDYASFVYYSTRKDDQSKLEQVQ